MRKKSVHQIFKVRYSQWSEVEAALFGISDNLERGDAFEEFASFYLKYFHNIYDVVESVFPRVDKVAFPDDAVTRLNLGIRDYGIDGICKRSDGDLLAVQVKFRSGENSVTYTELATFWSEAELADYRLVFTNSPAVTSVAQRRRGHLQVALEQLSALNDDFFVALTTYAASSVVAPPPKKTPRSYQQAALDDIIAGFDENDRGKLIAACGIGKTLISLWVSERLGAESVIFMAPNLQLIRQTLSEWSAQAADEFHYIAVCSDTTVDAEVDELSNAIGSDVPITTDVDVVHAFLRKPVDGMQVVFSTYQSLEVVAKATKEMDGFEFSLGIFDEAHKTAGLDANTYFGMGLHQDTLPVSKRLFMTATERLFTPRIQRAAERESRLVFSMDNLALYGPTFHRLSFSEAIDQKIISDYRVVVALLTEEEVLQVVRNYDLVIDPDDPEALQRVMRTSQIFNYVLLKKACESLGIRKAVAYHSTVEEARAFALTLNQRKTSGESEIDGFSVNGSMSSGERQRIIRNFEKAEVGALTNARCLIEGVDIPLIDAVFFAAPKNSLVDIVQALGRALRKPYGNDDEKMAYVIIPIVTTRSNENIDVTDSEFDRVYNVIQALRDQDDAIADQIDRLNLTVATGNRPGPGIRPDFIQLLLPGLLSVQDLEDALALRIAEVNARPTGITFSPGSLGQGERGSGRERLIRTIGDYTPLVYKNSLVDPTLDKMAVGKVYERKDIQINNNNVAHCVKLGVISPSGTSQFRLTRIGSLYKQGEVSFEDLFRNQIVLYADRQASTVVHPYRLLMQFLIEIKSMRYFDFLYGIYPWSSGIDTDSSLRDAIERANLVREATTNVHLANEASKQVILEQLSDLTGISYAFNDVWTDRTTTYNQFRYFRRHLELFDGQFQDQQNTLSVRLGHEGEIAALLEKTENLLSADSYGASWWLS